MSPGRECCDPRRVLARNAVAPASGPVVYWMSRDPRVRDNWALLHAQELALELQQPLQVVFTLAPAFPGAALRAYDFLLRGLAETARDCAELNIGFTLLRGDPPATMARHLRSCRAGALVTDFDPLRIKRAWRDVVARETTCAFHEVDAHNIVPCRWVSTRREVGAYTLRPKIRRALPDFLRPIPAAKRHPHGRATPDGIDVPALLRWLKADTGVGRIAWMEPGGRAAARRLDRFVREQLGSYAQFRNFPELDNQSNLSPYLHFGQISAQRVALEAEAAPAAREDKDDFLEELIVRRELADNFCWYAEDYDRVTAFAPWAQTTLKEHEADPRAYRYDRGQLEAGDTHDPLWNAAQMEMVRRGKMHGYLRMYWAKKILEWTPDAGTALEMANTLNDRYELDGRDPNGYTGTAWAIGGVHDRPWPTRPIFGKIRFMSYNGCRGKFDIAAYIRRVDGVPGSGLRGGGS